MEIPNKYYVGGQLMEVTSIPHFDDEKLGKCCVAEGSIKIADTFSGKFQSQSCKFNTFLHELVHSILDTMGEDELSNNEKFVSTFSSFLSEAVRTMEFPKSSLWHSSDKPDMNRDVLIETDLGGYVVGTYTFPEKHIKRWLYIDDLKNR